MGNTKYKAVPVLDVSETKGNDGIVTALVAVTGIQDNVGDIILPGAFQKSLAVRKAKGVWHHDVTSSVSKTEEIKELLPGDALLPTSLPDGSPWPAQAGGLMVKTRFNLKTQRGRDAYEDVKFFGTDQEWSIGYNVPTGGATVDKKTGVRSISTLNLYEYSPVLFGAMPNARTMSVKSAQQAWKALGTLDDLELKSILTDLANDQAAYETKSDDQKPWDDDDKDPEGDDDPKDSEDDDETDDESDDDDTDDDTDEDDDETKGAKPPWLKRKIKKGDPKDSDDDDDKDKPKKKGGKKLPPWMKSDDDEDDDDEEKSLFLNFKNVDVLQRAIDAMTELKSAIIAEAKADDGEDDDTEDEDDLESLVKAAGLDVGEHAHAFGVAVSEGDSSGLETAGAAILDAVETKFDAEDADKNALNAVAGFVAKAFEDEDGDDDADDSEDPDDSDDDDSDDEDDDSKIEKKGYVRFDASEFDDLLTS